MKNGFIRVGTATPRLCVADPAYNANRLADLTLKADANGVRVLAFPELSLTASTCGDLFYYETLISGAEKALQDYLKQTANTATLAFIGLPVAIDQRLYNCAAACFGGRLLGLIPKTAVSPAESRYFTTAPKASVKKVSFCNTEIPFGTALLFAPSELPLLKVAVEIGSDAALPTPPSVLHTAAGATVICNLSAAGEIVGMAERRRQIAKDLSARTLSGYLLCEAGEGESTTDHVFGGQQILCENGAVLAERAPFDTNSDLTYTELDLDHLLYERRRSHLFESHGQDAYETVSFSLPVGVTELSRAIDPHPFIPNEAERASRCEAILSIQTAGLKTRVERAYAKKLVIGISGGLDSTLALLVMVRAIDELKRPRRDILAVTMPCFGTTKRTKTNATVLCEELGVDFRTVDIFDAVNIHFRDIGHDPDDLNVTYENSQARERTQILMDIANDCGGMVIGTGDLSELALGWATYNGDHMSMYGVNADIPKTLVRYLVAHCADAFDRNGKQKVADALRDVLNTPVSPELLPANENGEIAQKTEDLVGPYELHDFYLYHMLRYGTPPAKLYRLAKQALGGTYDDETLKKWLKIFVRRFFNQQFKRSCLPDGPKVGSVGLSPRGDWSMPSDASSALWQAEAELL